LCSYIVNLIEDQLKQLTGVCESQDEEENDVDEALLEHLSSEERPPHCG